MHNPTSVLENDTHKLLWDFDTQTDHLISARRPDLNKKRELAELLTLLTQLKLKESKKKAKYLGLARKLKKLWNMKVTIYTNYNWYSWYSHQRINKETGGLGNKRTTNGDHPNYCIIEIVQNTEKSPGDLKKLAVTQTAGKNSQGVTIIIIIISHSDILVSFHMFSFKQVLLTGPDLHLGELETLRIEEWVLKREIKFNTE